MNQHLDNVFRERLFALILASLLLSAGGCAHVTYHVDHAVQEGREILGMERWPYYHSRATGEIVPKRLAATHGVSHVEPAFYGYHATCWRPWPGGWCGCPVVREEYFLEEAPAEPQPIEALPERQARGYQEGKKQPPRNPYAGLPNQSSPWDGPNPTVLHAPGLSD